MGKLFDFEEERAKLVEHAAGPAQCLYCKHEWVVAVPLGVDHFQCPRCMKFAGILKYLFVPDSDVFRCICGNELFYYTPDGPFCPRCGIHHGS